MIIIPESASRTSGKNSFARTPTTARWLCAISSVSTAATLQTTFVNTPMPSSANVPPKAFDA